MGRNNMQSFPDGGQRRPQQGQYGAGVGGGMGNPMGGAGMGGAAGAAGGFDPQAMAMMYQKMMMSELLIALVHVKFDIASSEVLTITRN